MNDIQNFDRSEARKLAELLGTAVEPSGCMSYGQTVGFLFVVACAPEVINPREWLTIVLREGADKKSETDVNQILTGLMSLYNELNRQVQEADTALLPGCEFRETPIDNFNEDAPIHQWAMGFVIGFSWLSKMWSEYVPAELSEEIAAHQMVLAHFADRKTAQEFLDEEVRKEGITLEKMASDMQNIFPDAMKAFAVLGKSIQTVLAERPEAEQPHRSEKVGRNEPCPCGSGTKYKKCCGLKMH